MQNNVRAYCLALLSDAACFQSNCNYYADRVYSGKRKAMAWCLSVCLSVCPVLFLTLMWIHQDQRSSTRRHAPANPHTWKKRARLSVGILGHRRDRATVFQRQMPAFNRNSSAIREPVETEREREKPACCNASCVVRKNPCDAFPLSVRWQHA